MKDSVLRKTWREVIKNEHDIYVKKQEEAIKKMRMLNKAFEEYKERVKRNEETKEKN